MEVYTRVGEIVMANPAIQSPGDVHVWLVRNYMESLAIGIRRLVDEDEDSLSLARLLLDISSHNKALTRGSYIHWFTGDAREAGHEQFDEHAGVGASYLPKEVPQRDFRRVKRAAREVVRITNRLIAHYHVDGRRRRVRSIPFDEVHAAVHEIEQVFLKYRVLLTAKYSDRLLPTWMYDWTVVFRQPWIEDKGGTRGR
jgi:hypothetical protein